MRNVQAIATEFSDLAGFLPGGVPLQALYTKGWQLCLAVTQFNLASSSTCPKFNSIRRFIEAVCIRLEIPVAKKLIPEDYRADTWQFRTDGEGTYLTEMVRWGEGDSVGKAGYFWSGARGVSQEAMFWRKPILISHFRELKRGDHHFFSQTVRFERRFLPENGFFEAYHMLEAADLKWSACSNRYVSIPSWWQDYEVPRGFWAELGAVYTYCSTHLFDPK